MQKTFSIKAVLAALAAVPLAGCGLFNSSGLDRYEINDPDRIAARVTASVAATTQYTADAPTTTAVFTAILYDADGRQFYGPELLMDGEKVDPVIASANNPSRYVKAGIPFAPGDTHTVTIQGNTGSTPPAIPALKVTAPARATGTDNAGNPITFNYFEQAPHQGVTLTWSGGDPGRPVYIVIWGDPTSTNGQNLRRLFVRDNPAQSPTDNDNYGLPIANTGSYTIPAELTERIVGADGQTTTRTVPTFDNPRDGGDPRRFSIYVVQKTDTVRQGPLELTSLSLATAIAGVQPQGD